MDKQYIILNDNKQPIHKFKDGGLTWEEVEEFDNIALIVPDPFVVLDFDTVDDAKVMLEIVEKNDLHCKVMKTDRGYHFWFRTLEPLKNFVKQRLAIGLYCDRKVCNRNAYVKIKGNGVMREWLRDYDDNDVDFLPKWLTPVSVGAKQFQFLGMSEGDGRNQALFNYIIYLQQKGFNKSEVLVTLDIINKFVFAKPLSKKELQTICRSEAVKPEETVETENSEKVQDKDFKFKHEVFALVLRDEYHFISVNGNLYHYKDGYYQPNTNEAELLLVTMFPGIKKQQRTEVIDYLKIIADKTEQVAENQNDPFTVNLLNGRYNLLTNEFTDHDASKFDFIRVPLNYDPKAKHEILDETLNNIFCNDKEVLNLFDEMLADCLTKINLYQTGFIFYGSGSNGKSTIFEVLRKFLGEKNISALQLEDYSKTFRTAELEHKLANIGDDLNRSAITDNGTVKKVFSGDAIEIERKYGKPYVIKPYATQIFACNEIPHTSDKSHGMMRRLCLVPCLAKFGEGGIKKDTTIRFKITTEEAMSHLFNRAIKGFYRLTKNGAFTEPKVVKEAKQTYMIDNSSVLTWVEEQYVDVETVISKPAYNLYGEFCKWCKDINVRNTVSLKGFYKEISRKFNLNEKLQQRRVDGVRGRFFVVKID